MHRDNFTFNFSIEYSEEQKEYTKIFYFFYITGNLTLAIINVKVTDEREGHTRFNRWDDGNG